MDDLGLVCCQEWENDDYTPLSNNFLYQVLQEKKIKAFRCILELKSPKTSFNINHVYGEPHYGSLLDIACQDVDLFDFVPLLIQYRAKINIVNEIHGKAPLHFAIELSDTTTLQYLLNIAYIDVNIVDNTGGTALHLACKLGMLRHVKVLLRHQKVRVNALNEKNQTPIELAIVNKNKEIICELLKREDIDIDFVETSSKASLRKLITDEFPELALNLPKPRERNRDNAIDMVSKLFLYLRQRNLESFTKLLKEDLRLVNSGLGDYTFFQYACEYGLYDFVDLLLSSEVNPICATNYRAGFMLACERGYYRIVSKLVGFSSTSFSLMNEGTVLHTIIQHSATKYASFLGLPAKERDYFTSLKIILKQASSEHLNVNKKDARGNTALHYAAKIGNRNLIFLLLDSGADIRTKNGFGKPPLAYISSEILEAYFDQCIRTNGNIPVDDDYEVHFLHNFLLPAKSRKQLKKSMCSILNGDAEFGEIAVTPTSETDPLLYMSESPEHRPLLIHPVVTSFIHFKWHSIRWFFFCNLAFYTTFWSLLTAYIIGSYNINQNNTTNSTQAQTNGTNSSEHNIDAVCLIMDVLQCVVNNLRFLLVILLLMLVIREIFEMYVSPVRYIKSIENWMELALIIVTGLILLDGYTNLPRNQLSAMGILLSWGEFVLLIGRHPWLCTKIEMFRTVTRNFLEFFSWYSILILAFALSFYSLFKDAPSANKDVGLSKPPCKNETDQAVKKPNEFLYPGRSIFKTLVMLTGEFETGEIPFDSNYGIGYILFVLFIFLIAIVLFNLLNGLAVNDTQAIRNDAELVGIVSHAEFISYIETILQRDHDWFRLPDSFSKTNRFIASIFSELRALLPPPFQKISVLPNQGNTVKQARSCEFTVVCFAMRRDFMMKKSIVQAAKEVLKKRNEMLENEKRLDECGRRVQRELEKLLEKYFEVENNQCRRITRTQTK